MKMFINNKNDKCKLNKIRSGLKRFKIFNLNENK